MKLHLRFTILILVSSLIGISNPIQANHVNATDEIGATMENLVSFTVNLNNGQVNVAWNTSSETNNDYFVIERSSNGIDFEEVIRTSGAGTTTNEISYFEVDYEPIVGISYYRLKEVDLEGEHRLSSVVPVEMTEDHQPGTNLFPNAAPVDSIGVVLESFKGEDILVVLRNEKGVEFYGMVQIQEAENDIIVSSSDGMISEGEYHVVSSSKNELYSRNVTVK